MAPTAVVHQTKLFDFFGVRSSIVKTTTKWKKRLSFGEGEVFNRLSNAFYGTFYPSSSEIRPLDNLPLELRFRIVESLDCESLVAYALTNKTNYQLVKSFLLSPRFRLSSDMHVFQVLTKFLLSFDYEFVVQFMLKRFVATFATFEWDSFFTVLRSSLVEKNMLEKFLDCLFAKAEPWLAYVVDGIRTRFSSGQLEFTYAVTFYRLVFLNLVGPTNRGQRLFAVARTLRETRKVSFFVIGLSCYHLDAYDPDSLNLFLNTNCSKQEPGTSALAKMSQNLRSLIEFNYTQNERFSRREIFQMFEMITTTPGSWELTTFAFFCINVPAAFQLFVQVRIHINNWEEITDIILTACYEFAEAPDVIAAVFVSVVDAITDSPDYEILDPWILFTIERLVQYSSTHMVNIETTQHKMLFSGIFRVLSSLMGLL